MAKTAGADRSVSRGTSGTKWDSLANGVAVALSLGDGDPLRDGFGLQLSLGEGDSLRDGIGLALSVGVMLSV
jgi:hypothetical protein